MLVTPSCTSWYLAVPHVCWSGHQFVGIVHTQLVHVLQLHVCAKALSGLDGPLIGPICFTSLVPEGKRHSLASKDLGSNNRRDAAERLRFPCTVEFLQNPRRLSINRHVSALVSKSREILSRSEATRKDDTISLISCEFI